MIFDMTKRVSGGDSSFINDEATIRNIRFQNYTDTTNEIEVDLSKLPHLVNINEAFSSSGFTKITIVPPTYTITTQRLFYTNTALTEINIIGTLKLRVNESAYEGFASSCTNLVSINGILDCSAQTRAGFFNGTNYLNAFNGCSKLRDITFKNGCMKLTTTNWNLSWCAALSDASLVSIANALLDEYSGTITFHATPKARLSTIMGTVTTTDGFSTFTQSASGTVSLYDFLTTTKHATIA